MAKYTVTRACGHVEVVNLIGPGKTREWRLETIEPSKLCSECYQKQLAEQRERDNREAAEAAKDMRLPALTGTEAQIPWAETIRQQLLADIDMYVYEFVGEKHRNDPKLVEAIENIKAKTEARWWIDHRFCKYTSFRELLEKSAKEVKASRLEQTGVDAKIEATVRPEKPRTETVAEIRALEKEVEINFPERRDDFRELVKGMGYRWDNGCWRRKLTAKNGTPQDRAAEAGHMLLGAGFAIRIYDEDTRQKAISGDYEPECTRWVQKRTEGKYDGWLAIGWKREDDFYNAAKRLPGARWSNPSMVVPPENFAEVLDFAQMYGFKVSEAAQGVIEAARYAREATLTAKVEPVAKQGKVIADGKPPVLEVPAEVGIDDEFKD